MGISPNAERNAFQGNDWERIVRTFAHQYEMNFFDALHWISGRYSLQVACEILGVALSTSMPIRYTSADLDILNSLGDFLWTRGHHVPLLMEHHKIEYVWRERDMGFSLSREEYLKERALGKSKNRIAHQQGISGPALFHWLGKWGLKDAEVEKKEIDRLVAAESERSGFDVVNHANGENRVICVEAADHGEKLSTPAPSQSVDAHPDYGEKQPLETGRNFPASITSDTPLRNKLTLVSTESRNRLDTESTSCTESGEMLKGLKNPSLSTGTSASAGFDSSRTNSETLKSVLVQLCMPLTSSTIPETIKPSALSRDELMQTALALFQSALGQAYRDLTELLGETRAADEIQQYVDNQIYRYFRQGDL